jgi:hypothetical protein
VRPNAPDADITVVSVRAVWGVCTDERRLKEGNVILRERSNVSGIFCAGAPDIGSMLLSRVADLQVAVLHWPDN